MTPRRVPRAEKGKRELDRQRMSVSGLDVCLHLG